VSKLSPDGSALVFSAYLGGTGSDFGADIAVDAEGRAHVTGTTLAPDFPVANAFQPTFGGAIAEDVELKFWLEAPGFGIVSLVGSPTRLFSLPPTPAFTIVSDAAIPPELPFPGTIIGARLLRPASGDVWSESICARAPCH
jgi:hypothetical protein